MGGLNHRAKSKNRLGEEISLKEHGGDVAKYASEYAEPMGMKKEAFVSGLFHDFGKFAKWFGDVLDGLGAGVDHAIPGAVVTYRRCPDYIPTVIAAHHSELRALSKLRAYGLLDIGYSGLTPDGKTVSMQSDEYAAAVKACLEYFGPVNLNLTKKIDPDVFCRMMRCRMLLSCLVDADWSVSAYEDARDLACLSEGGVLSVELSTQSLVSLRAEASKRPCSSQVRDLRNRVWDDCTAAGRSDASLMSLTAPTGAGKTFGFLRFALERCKHDITRKRIVLVLPFLSLTDQVFNIASAIIPGTICDTSTAEYSEQNRELASRWNAPCIVTTAVQFFGSVCSARPADVRKLHRLSDAVVIFDEMQSLPDHLLKTALQAVCVLVRDYNMTAVMSTATPPVYSHVLPDCSPTEIIQDVPGCFALAPAEHIELLPGELEISQVAGMAAGYENCCVITNMKRHALEVYRYWVDAGLENVFLLSTDLCPVHRQQVIKAIDELQKAGEPVHVSATQCIEAGVDLDFGQIFRAAAPLPSLIQSAGRQNRARRRPRGTMFVFVPARQTSGRGRNYPDGSYEKSAGIALDIAMRGMDLSSREALAAYYDTRFLSDLTKPKLRAALDAEDYHEFMQESRLIKSGGRQVVVPTAGYEELYNQALGAALDGGATRKLLAETAKISVQSYSADDIERNCVELVIGNKYAGTERHTGVYVLLDNCRGCYHADIGLQWDNDGDMFML